jgi:hypothetical protein
MSIQCPFCKCKSDPINNLFDICPHIIACFDTIENAFANLRHREYPFILNDIVNTLIMEFLPFKLLSDFILNIDSNSNKFNIKNVHLEYTMNDINGVYTIYYTNELFAFINSFNDFIIDINFRTSKMSLRSIYILYKLAFENKSPSLEHKIRPMFHIQDEPWLNLDYAQFSGEMLNAILNKIAEKRPWRYDEETASMLCYSEIDSLLNSDFNNNQEARTKAEDIIWQYLLDDDMDYEITKWLLHELRFKYGLYKYYNNFFKERDFNEDFYNFEDYLITIYSDNKREIQKKIIESFKKLKSYNFLRRIDKFFNRPINHFAEHFIRSGIIRDFRTFIEDTINTLIIDADISIDRGIKIYEKLDKLVEQSVIDNLLKNKLLFLYKHLSSFVHKPEITSTDINEIKLIKELFFEQILTQLSFIIKK